MDQRQLIEVELQQLYPNRFQPRKFFSQDELRELAQSIAQHGLLQPPLVAALPSSNSQENAGTEFEIIAGERRVQSCRILGMKSIPAILVKMTDRERLEAALIENVQRIDLNPLEIAHALKKMADDLQLDQEAIAERVGKKRSTVSNYIRLLQLPEKIQEEVAKGAISMAHAKLLLSCENSKLQEQLFQSIIKNGTTIKGCLKLIQEWERSAQPTPIPDVHVQAVEERLQRIFGTKTTINGGLRGGEVSFSFYSKDDLERLLDLLGASEICT